ncbi:M23 family metallopeptidase [Exilibacterium tricleocarpae]|uniref:M23 family metallopeptidase n=1 Tax=Exilibacterium tricleocarpae TaxID=2591008 RepID=A0A545U716_9GAMM|nr:M23 family metallopeptidase [Exilibacterium tricleocarpae]TQV85240.1 M23 family metallopeptidase [Exilibacterium tricleocarpae]
MSVKGKLQGLVVGLCLAGSGACSGLEIEGVWQQGATLVGRVAPQAQVSFAGRRLRTTEQGHFVVGLDRDAAPEAVIRVHSQTGAVAEHRFAVKQRQYNIQRIEGVPKKTVNPPSEALARIRREAALAREARRQDLPRQDFLQGFIWPLQGPVTGVYGSQRYYNGEPRRPHYGVDVAAPTGTPVRAPAAGKVTLAYDDMFFSGGTLILDHGHGLSSTFIHLSKILVESGQEISQGQAIAEVGATGRATGPHLDWRMNWFEFRVDPQLLVGDMPGPD